MTGADARRELLCFAASNILGRQKRAAVAFSGLLDAAKSFA
jgi:hypothetical protein